MIIFLTSWCAGVVSLLWLPELPQLSWLLLAALLVLPFIFRFPFLRALLGFGMGMAYAVFHADVALESRVDRAWEGQLLQVQGVITGLPEPASDFGLRLRIQPERVTLNGQHYTDVKGLWQLTAPAANYLPGERWVFTARVKRPNGWSNPGSFDYEIWLLQEGVRAVGYARAADRMNTEFTLTGQQLIDRYRLSIRHRFQQIFPEHAPSGVLLALLTGDRALVDQAAWNRYAATGITHLMAISGLHITMVAFVVTWLSAFMLRYTKPMLALRVPRPLISITLGCIAAFLYCLLAGMSLPTQRTFLMLLTSVAVLWLRREWGPWTVLVLALSVVLMREPMAVHAVGLWLSFFAVALLVLLAWPRPFEAAWKSFGRSQWIMTLGLLPLSLVIFARLSWVSPVANILAIPLVTFVVVPLGMLGLLLGHIWPEGGSGLWRLGVHIVGTLDEVLAQMASWPWAFRAWHLPPWGWFWLSLAVAVALMPKGLAGRYLAILFLLPLLWGRAGLPEGAWRMTVLDVGQGLSVVIETQKHRLIYDTGPSFSESFDTGTRVVMPYLHYQGINKVDVLMLSHDDLDHTGGAQAILANMPPNMLRGVWPKELSSNSAFPVTPCQQGQQWLWDGVLFEVLFPRSDIALSGTNNQSCVLKVSGGGFSALIPGDIERNAEWALLETQADVSANVLVLGHHGSHSSSGDWLLDEVKPSEAIASAGYLNRFGHPAAVVRSRLQARDIALFETANTGAITYTITLGENESSPSVRRTLWREQAGHYWLKRD